MEIVSSIVLVASPFAITALTNLVKKIKAVEWSNPVRRTALRTIVAVLSLCVAVGTSIIDGTEVDTSIIAQTSEAIVLFVASTGLYFWQKRKE